MKFLRYTLLLSVVYVSSGCGVEIDLSKHEKSFYSQNGEDGILDYLFSHIQSCERLCVECGAGDGISNSMSYFLRTQGWETLLFDRLFDIPFLNLHKEYITAENLNTILEKYHVSNTFALLIIHMRYNDFYLWKGLSGQYIPAVVCIGYNPCFSPDEDKVVPYHPFFYGDDSNYFGASMRALSQLGASKGYTLIYAEKSGHHLFFVRDDILRKERLVFKNSGNLSALYLNFKEENQQEYFIPPDRLFIPSTLK